MRTLLFMRGLPASGKSTYIREKGLEEYTVSTDALRVLYGGYSMDLGGAFRINQEVSRKVWTKVYEILENRFKLGAFTVFDATNIKTKDMKTLCKKAKEYRYRVYCVDFSDIGLEECVERDGKRPAHQQVGRGVIESMYASLVESELPGGVTVIKPTDSLDELDYKPRNLDGYKKIVHIGDIHGCYTVLSDYLKGGIDEDTFYIFLGDYLDRGVENAEVLQYLSEICELPNVVLIEGNHEAHLKKYAKGEESRSKEFEGATRKALDKLPEGRKKSERVCRKLVQCFAYEYKGKKVLCTHGGLSRYPDKLMFVNTEQMIKGVGYYNEMATANKSFCENHEREEVYQIHGHRNEEGVGIKVTARSYNLNSKVELGGELRVLELGDRGFEGKGVVNTVYASEERELKADTGVEKLAVMENNPYIKVKKQEGTGIVSINFRPKAFYEGVWDEMTVKARGLFVEKQTGEVVARGYEKWFNIGERQETTEEVLKNKMVFPVVSYKKENGFLGIMSYNRGTDEIMYCTKSEIAGQYGEYFRKIVEQTANIGEIKHYLSSNNVTLTFEVIDVENDPHIIEYPKSKVVLLDIIENSWDFKKRSFEEVQRVAKTVGVESKELHKTLETVEDFERYIREIKEEGYKCDGVYIEGFVMEDARGYQVKQKCHYYTYWKYLRGDVQRWVKGRPYKVENGFNKWLHGQNPEDTEDKSIIGLRKAYGGEG